LNRLFWLFDLDSDEKIDHTEIAYSLNLFKEYTLEEKVQIFFELSDEDDNGLVSAQEIRKFFLKNLNSEDD
jgi:Ca2+-binding EF-hand superfamily protein